MKKHPFVTILVTVKNAKDTIEKCIKSLLSLNYPNFKIFVTDAYSDDGTWEILKKLNKKHPKKLRIEQVSGNAPTGHNYAIRKVKSEFIAFTDADCVVDKNWLKKLISGFKSDDIIATTGFCSTPKTVNKLQRLIGKELEDRFKHFPKYILRAPTMNLCVRTKFAKKIKYDERFDVAFETEWGYRLTKHGKMVYVPDAIVWHHHRPTWKTFFKQQFRYGRYVPLLYLKHKRMSTGDHISKPTMMLQEFVFFFGCLFFVISVIISLFPFKSNISIILELSLMRMTVYTSTAILFLVLFILYIVDIFYLTRKPTDIFLFFILFLFRTIAWTLGLMFGIYDLVVRKY